MKLHATPAEYIEGHTAFMAEHDPKMTRRDALHLQVTSLAQVIADDIAAGEDAYPATVDRYVYARDEYKKAAGL